MEKNKILIVEDEAIIAMEIESSLKSLGYKVTSIVDTGEKAIEKAEADKPDIILMDIRIKGKMDGIEAADVVRSRFDIPVIFLTAYLDKERIERAKITMPFGYLLKPIQGRDLKVTIEMALYVARVDRERKQVEKKLGESEEKYRDLVETSQGLIFKCDREGRFTFLNPSWEYLLGYQLDEMLGQPFTRFKSPELAEKDMETFKNILKGADVFGYETFYKTRSGELKNLVFNARLVKDDDGTVIGTQGTAHDVTKRKQAEEALQKAHEQLEQRVELRTRELVKTNEELRLQSEIMANMAEGVFLISSDDGIIVYTNPKFEKMFGYGPKELVGKHVSIVNAPTEKNPEETAAEIMEILHKRGIWQGEVHNVKKDGTLFWCYANVSVFDHSKYGKVLVSVHTDISARKLAEEKLLKNS